MKLFLFLGLALVFSSCFLLSDFKKERLTFTENGVSKNYTVVVPKGAKKTQRRVDSSGNEEMYYHYSNGTTLYFVKVVDTNLHYLPIDYETNLPKSIYNTLFFKGVDSSNTYYWRETRFDHYKLGYLDAERGEEWKFDSAINYFSLHLRK
jgi:hypothetical protein